VASRKASHIKTLFVDELQDSFAGHHDREIVWRDFTLRTSILTIQRAFFSATLPPHLQPVFFQKASLDASSTVIRRSTDRPELGYHVLTVNPSRSGVAIWESLKRLVFHLKTLLRSDERIVLFFQDEKEADLFATQTGCAKYHSKLPLVGKSKGYYFDLWARGESVVMAASTAFQQGVDYGWVAYVIYFKDAYGLIDYGQGGGRSGRRGRPSYVIILRDENRNPTCQWSQSRAVEDTHCRFAFLQLARNVKYCMRYMISSTMDGEGLAVSCKDFPSSNPCGICDPESTISKFIQWAVRTLIPSMSPVGVPPPQHVSAACIETDSDDEYGDMEFTPEMAMIMDNVEVPQAAKVDYLA
jgi:superfamily II DNA helicase RecQ